MAIPVTCSTGVLVGQVCTNESFATYVSDLLKSITPIILLIALVMIVYSGVEYMLASVGSDSKKAKQRIVGILTGVVVFLLISLILNQVAPSITTLPDSQLATSDGAKSSLPSGTTGDGTASSGSFTVAVDAISDGKISSAFFCSASTPTVTVSGLPSGTKSVALIVTDTTASPSYTHWIIWNVPVSGTSATISAGSGKQGTNSDGGSGWAQMCFLTGSAHTYQFTVYPVSSATLSITDTTIAGQTKAIQAGKSGSPVTVSASGSPAS